MLDVTRRFHLALSDLGRRAGLMAGAAIAGLVGAGFLLAALWSWLAHGLHWGPALASLAVGALCAVIAGGLMLAARKAQHDMPSTDDVQAELHARARLATDAAIGAVKTRAEQARSAAGQRLHGLWDRVRYRADRAAAGLDTTAARVAETVAETVGGTASRAGGHGGAARSRPGHPPAGAQEGAPNGAPPPDPLAGALHNARAMAEHFARSRAAPGVAVVSAFAVGLALANLFAGDDEDAEGEG